MVETTIDRGFQEIFDFGEDWIVLVIENISN